MLSLIWLDIFVVLSFAAACLASYRLGRPKSRKWAWSVLLTLAFLWFIAVMAHATLRQIWHGFTLGEFGRAMDEMYRWLLGAP
jgi:hypothetical protein